MNLNLEDQVVLDRYFSYLNPVSNVYRIIVDRKYPNTELIIGSKKAAVIDCGLGFGDLPSAVRKLTDKPLLIFNTHSHVDHIGGNAQFHQPIYMGTEDIPSTRGADYTFFREHMTEDRIARLGPDSVQGMDLEEFKHRGVGELLPCDEGDVFDLGGLTLRVLNVPGHSVGGRAYYVEELGYLYTGDAVFASTLCFGPGSATRQQHAESLKKMLALPFTAAITGHYIEPLDHEFIRNALHPALYAEYKTGIPLQNPIDATARVCFAPDQMPTPEIVERIKSGDHGLDNKVWAIVLGESTK
ncbi:MAG TPA: MBL fold metallo-hydrolase [Candidatus Limiplasma sp.]|jgi:glyoxylase-like metal-dependent hydrolase (beta-lactamase superfamily II)|nr:MBL fold metallo-hydrolase [Candidatus Limiplasma sp.]